MIIGGGFAGLKLARELNNIAGIDILLLDKLTFHQFQPLFYQVATASIEATNTSFPLRKIFQHSKNVRIRITEVLEIIPEKNMVISDNSQYYYDRLIIATGTETNFFGNQQIQSLAFPMKSTLEALRLMNRIINNFEDALDLTNRADEEKIMSIAIVGAGPTGVELAGALAEMKKNILPNDYPDLDLSLMNIYLLDHSRRPLAAMSERSGQDAKKYLEEMGVILRLGIGVLEFNGNELLLDDGNLLHVKTVIWAAGVKGALPKGIEPESIARGNRIKVDRFNKVLKYWNIYAIGDIAYMETPLYPNGHPQLASVAGSQAKHLAKNIKHLMKNQSMIPFEYVNRGVMATIGKRKAVVDLTNPKMHIKGRLAWLIWMFLHLFLILGVKNKVQIFINWVYKYFTADQSLRLAQRVKGRTEELEGIKPHKNSIPSV
jgi:NADH dehydrogenase